MYPKITMKSLLQEFFQEMFDEYATATVIGIIFILLIVAFLFLILLVGTETLFAGLQRFFHLS